MGSRTLILLRRGTVEGEKDQYDGQGAEGHRHGKECARMLQDGKSLHVATDVLLFDVRGLLRVRVPHVADGHPFAVALFLPDAQVLALAGDRLAVGAFE